MIKVSNKIDLLYNLIGAASFTVQGIPRTSTETQTIPDRLELYGKTVRFYANRKDSVILGPHRINLPLGFLGVKKMSEDRSLVSSHLYVASFTPQGIPRTAIETQTTPDRLEMYGRTVRFYSSRNESIFSRISQCPYALPIPRGKNK